jgi:hypothetical protein
MLGKIVPTQRFDRELKFLIVHAMLLILEVNCVVGFVFKSDFLGAIIFGMASLFGAFRMYGQYKYCLRLYDNNVKSVASNNVNQEVKNNE